MQCTLAAEADNDNRPAEFAKTIKDAMPRLRYFARKFTNNRTDADDVLQDALEWAVIHKDQYDEQRPLVGWLYNPIRSYARNLRRRKFNSAEHRPVEDNDVIGAAAQEHEVELTQVADFISTMPEDQAGALAMYAAGFTQTEIGELHGAGKSWGQYLLRRARAQLHRVAA